ncbi:MAG: AIR synthase-related protein [Oligoflexia bacterium]|nr:AIR synthase-related protein [Oligoflexia bacterium]
MFARFEVAVRPEFSDPHVQSILRKIQMVHPAIAEKVRWGRLMDVCWIEFSGPREDLIRAATEIFYDRVLQWMFSGNLIPSATGKHGGMLDIMEAAPNRPGKFWALERRFRGGVTDNVARTAAEAFEIVLGKKLPDCRYASGAMLLLEGDKLTEDDLALIARDVFCNELIETWTVIPESELKNNNRFHQERIKGDLPKVLFRGSEAVDTVDLSGLSDTELQELSSRKLWALSLEEMRAVRDHFNRSEVVERRKALGLEGLTDVEIEVIAQTWSEHCKHKIFGAKVNYSETSADRAEGESSIPSEIDSLFKTTIAGTTRELSRPWLLSVFSDNAGIVAFDDDDAFCIKVETHNSPSALDPYGGALTGIVGVNRDILGCGLGAKPIFNTDVFCVAPLDHREPLPDRLLHPRRILEGVRRGVEHGGNKSGIPTVNGALVFDERYLGKPLVYCGTGGFMPRMIAGRPCETKEIQSGDRIVVIGGRVGKDGIHGATFSSLALDESSPVSAVQLGDPITQKRVADFILEARDQGLYRAVTDNGAGGLSSSVGELAQLSGGARMDVSRCKLKYPGLRPFEIVVSESQERMTLAVPHEKLNSFLELAERRGVETSELGEFTNSGQLEILYREKLIASLDLEFLHNGVPRLELTAQWPGRPKAPVASGTGGGANSYEAQAAATLIGLMARPNIASKEWLIRQYDHEVQGTSVIKPLHTVNPGTADASSGPNDGAVLKPKLNSDSGLVVGCGINPKLSDVDPYLMAQSAVDEAVRNVLCAGADFGRADSVLALCDNFCWPDPVKDPAKMAALVRACYGMRSAALALSAPLVSGKDSMKNDFRGKLRGQPVTISVPPTLLMTAVAKISDIRLSLTSDFKRPGDLIYLLGSDSFGLWGSEVMATNSNLGYVPMRVAEPDWNLARKVYSWLGGAMGRERSKLRSLHDVSDGGLMVAVAECLIARGYGAQITLPPGRDPWEASFGEGFHAFVASASEADAFNMEAEWMALEVPFVHLGVVTSSDRLEVTTASGAAQSARWSTSIKQVRSAWRKSGYWE